MAVARVREGGGTEGITELIEQLREATAEAAARDYPRMGGLLHECGLALGGADEKNRRSLLERARKSLAVWRALRTL